MAQGSAAIAIPPTAAPTSDLDLYLATVKIDWNAYPPLKYIPETRTKLIGWIYKVKAEMHLPTECVFRAMWIYDRFLAKKQVCQSFVQLAAIVSINIALKFDTGSRFQLCTMHKLCAGAYTRQHIVNMEKDILRQIEYRIATDTAYTWLLHFCDALHLSEENTHSATHLLIQHMSGDTFTTLPAIYSAFSVVRDLFSDYADVAKLHTTIKKFI